MFQGRAVDDGRLPLVLQARIRRDARRRMRLFCRENAAFAPQARDRGGARAASRVPTDVWV
jgi:hypothetical protein